MEIEIINGQFSGLEVDHLISQMIGTKIKFLENKISNLNQEEDIKNKEAKIIALQNKLATWREKLKLKATDFKLYCTIQIDF